MNNLSLKDLLRKFCLESSILGLKYFYLYPNRISRCYWALALIGLLMFAVYLALLLKTRFVEMPTRITIENQYEAIDNMPYPAITICSPNQITVSATEHLKNTLVDGNMSLPIEIVLPKLLGYFENAIQPNMNNMKELQDLFEANRYDVLDVLTLLPQNCDDFLKICFFEQKKYKCSELFNPLMTSHGLCCVFNSMYYFKEFKRNERNHSFKPRMASIPAGFMNGLTVVAGYDYENALDDSIIYAGGITMTYSDWSEFPTDDHSSVIPVQTESYHAIHSTYTYCSESVESLSDSSRGCHFENELLEENPKYFLDYHNSECELMCIVRAVEKSCGCILFHVPNVKMSEACNAAHVYCFLSHLRKMHKEVLQPCDCPRDCTSRNYNIETDVGNLYALPHMVRNFYSKYTEITATTSIIHAFFSSSVFTKQKQETMMSLSTLQSNLGGVFGLCLGCSLMSVLEILFYIYIAAKNYIQHNRKRSRENRKHYKFVK